MSSGVAVSEASKKVFNAMKVNKSTDDAMERLRIVVFVIGAKEVEVEKEYRQKDLEDVEDIHKFFCSVLKEKGCRFVLYDCHFETKETKKEELVFGLWNPDDACIKDKLMYSSTKGAVSKAFTGLKHNIAINGFAEIGDRDSFMDKLGYRGKTISLEGNPL